jgi:hypothetical protein
MISELVLINVIIGMPQTDAQTMKSTGIYAHVVTEFHRAKVAKVLSVTLTEASFGAALRCLSGIGHSEDCQLHTTTHLRITEEHTGPIIGGDPLNCSSSNSEMLVMERGNHRLGPNSLQLLIWFFFYWRTIVSRIEWYAEG